MPLDLTRKMYTDSLTLEQVATTRLKASRDLVADAEVLYRERRWARALFLSQIAVEEAGKYSLRARTSGDVE